MLFCEIVFFDLFGFFSIDPTAGSPTVTLLRLLLPLNCKIRCNLELKDEKKMNSLFFFLSLLAPHRTIQSVGATGGVYKEQGRNQCKLLTCVY